MTRESTRSIAVAKKESLLYREVSSLLGKLTMDEPSLQGLMVTRVQLSANKSLCTVFFYAPQGELFFRERLGALILYKPSMRKALSQAVHGRYTPDIKFAYDQQFEKIERVNTLLLEVSSSNRAYDAEHSDTLQDAESEGSSEGPNDAMDASEHGSSDTDH